MAVRNLFLLLLLTGAAGCISDPSLDREADENMRDADRAFNQLDQQTAEDQQYFEQK